MNIADKTVLVTGANRGIGQALVQEALQRDVARVYAASRQPLSHPDDRVVPLIIDVTDPVQIRTAAERIESLDVLVNNAGVAIHDDLTDRAVLEQHLSVNLFGTFETTQAFLPALTRSQGAVVNVSSVSALAALPLIPSYSVSKAAMFSLSQSLRALLAPRGITVHVVLAGPVDTDMSADLAVAKASAQSVAQAILDEVARGDEEIFPDPMTAPMAEQWRTGTVKQLERQNAALLQAVGAGA